jgi:hypothetical protein
MCRSAPSHLVPFVIAESSLDSMLIVLGSLDVEEMFLLPVRRLVWWLSGATLVLVVVVVALLFRLVLLRHCFDLSK